MAISLYYTFGSAPCHAVMFTAKILGIELDLKFLDLDKKEQFEPAFLKLNPQHTIPTIVDGEFILWDSKAIMIYLVERYGKESSPPLYPSDPQAKAVVNQRLFFDMGTLYQRFADLYYPLLFVGAPFDDERFKKLQEAFSFLDGFLENNDYVAGEKLTLADVSIVTTVSVAEACNFDITKYPNVVVWYDKIKLIPGYAETDGKGAAMFHDYYLSVVTKE